MENIHDYLDMDFNYSEPGEAKASTIKHPKTFIDDLTEYFRGMLDIKEEDQLLKIRLVEEADFLYE